MGAKQMKCLSSPSPTHSPRAESVISQSEDKGELVDDQSEERKSCDAEKASSHGPGAAPVRAGPLGRGTWEQLCEQQEQLEKEVQEARRMVSSLQALLLHGSLPEDEQEVALSLREGDGAESTEQQLIIIRSRLDQSMEESQDLKKELLRYKQETLSLQGIKDALQQRLTVQDSTVLQLKQELLQSNTAREELAGQNAELQTKLEEQDRLLNEYKKEIGQKHRLLQQQQSKLEEALYDQKLPGAQSNGYPSAADGARPSASPCRAAEELQLVRDALRSLRNSFSGHDPQHHTLDTLEQGVASLMDRLHALDPRRRQDRRVRGRSPGHRANPTNHDSWPPSTKMAHSQSSPVLHSDSSTKVLYFTDRSLTPFLINIPKRLGEVTLRDFKVAVDREGTFRYHFKSLDPEFGTVKEEVFQDDAVVPGWEGKIVAWVEEDSGDSR
ncbi:dixin-A isoform X2 [Megalops cyprinoides]|uniref:dixin-A isoform X2 n=1 Tax=Megalops cyprinoides TaxID=118141 RepID=UPI0018644718|nr:dixin-A isoform X2 [Megalops cyprinoides]